MKKEASTLQDSDKGLRIQQSPRPSTSWADQVDVVEVSDQEKQEASDQENPGIIDITNGPTSANEVWMVVGKKKKVHVTSKPMVTRSQARKSRKKTSSSPTN
jgi:hypothetical protein